MITLIIGFLLPAAAFAICGVFICMHRWLHKSKYYRNFNHYDDDHDLSSIDQRLLTSTHSTQLSNDRQPLIVYSMPTYGISPHYYHERHFTQLFDDGTSLPPPSYREVMSISTDRTQSNLIDHSVT